MFQNRYHPAHFEARRQVRSGAVEDFSRAVLEKSDLGISGENRRKPLIVSV